MRRWSGARPVRWLLDHAPVDARWCLVHATHMDAEERARLARGGAVAGLCPITEANLGDGIFNAPAFVAAADLRRRQRFQCRDRRRGRIAAARICAAAARRARNVCAAAAARPAARFRRGRGRRRAGAGAPQRALRPARTPTSSRSLRPPCCRPRRRSDPRRLDFQRRQPLVDCVWSGGARWWATAGIARARRSRRGSPRRCAASAR